MTTGDFTIDIIYSGKARYLDEFEVAAKRWEEIIIADLPDAGAIDDLRIDARVIGIDGQGGVLARAMPTELRKKSGLPYEGIMQFDKVDAKSMEADGTLTSLITHEMGHVLGLGLLWDRFGFIDRSTTGYTGPNALEEYRKLYGNGAASYVPLETGGGSGTAYNHWSEIVFGEEIMTGWRDGNTPISRVTIGALEDLGYTVRYAEADPFAF